MEGVGDVKIEEQKRPFKVTYDPKKVTVEQMLKKLADAGETAKKKT